MTSRGYVSAFTYKLDQVETHWTTTNANRNNLAKVLYYLLRSRISSGQVHK
jgi:hypothetical protein